MRQQSDPRYRSDGPDLDRNHECPVGIAFCAFEDAQVKARRSGFDAGQPHRLAALSARQNTNLGTGE